MLVPLLLGALALAPHRGPVYNGRDGQLHVRIPRIEAEAVIDGDLNDPAWQQAALLTGFSEFSPQDGLPAIDSTQILIWYSPSALYIGVRAFETDGLVHATLAARDSISADDNVQILLGTFHDQHRAYLFAVNPLGVQMDGTIVEQGQAQTSGWTPTLSGRAAPDLSQDFVFASKGHLTSFGYQVEIRIPFKSIKYQSADSQHWAINIVREVQHSGYEDSWVPAKRSNASFLAQSGSLEGLTGLSRGLALDLNPVVTDKITGAPGSAGWAYDRATPQPGGNLRWGMTNNLTLNATIKPDFAEVESDAGQVVLDPREALYFPEKRPFFLDGLDQFSVPNNLIYTRRIIAPDGAVKLTGQVAGTNIAFLSAMDAPDTSTTARGRTLYDIVRAQRDFANQAQLGMAFTDREMGADYNRMADIDGQVLFGQVYNGSFQAAESFDRTGGVGRNAPLLSGIFARNGKRFGLRYTFTSISNDFLPGAGFISRAGVVNAALDHRATWFGERGSVLETFTGDLTLNDTWEYTQFVRHGDAEDKKLHVSASAGLRGGWTLGAGVYWETFGYDPALYADYRILTPSGDTLPFTGTPRIPNRDYVTTLTTPQWSRFSGNLVYIFGQDENFYEWAQANIQYAALSVSVRPNARARILGTLAYQGYWWRTDQSLVGSDVIPRVTVEYQLTRSIFFRIVGQYNVSQTADLRDETRTFDPLIVGGQLAIATRARMFNGDYLFSYQPNPGTVLFIGYGGQADGTPDPTQRFMWQPLRRVSDYFFVKWSYLFRM